MDILALTNNSVNFILYCSMSRAFRDTFLSLICPYYYKSKKLKFEQIEFGRLNQKDLNDLDKDLDQMVLLTTNQALIIFPLSDTK